MTRKSTRLAVQAKPVAMASSSTTLAPDSKPQPKPRKRQKATAPAVENGYEVESPAVQDRTNYSRVRGRRGQLKIMTEMPTDILLEIFSRLQPLDLLHIAHATKALRALVTGGNTAYIWKLVRLLKPPLVAGFKAIC